MMMMKHWNCTKKKGRFLPSMRHSIWFLQICQPITILFLCLIQHLGAPVHLHVPPTCNQIKYYAICWPTSVSLLFYSLKVNLRANIIEMLANLWMQKKKNYNGCYGSLFWSENHIANVELHVEKGHLKHWKKFFILSCSVTISTNISVSVHAYNQSREIRSERNDDSMLDNHLTVQSPASSIKAKRSSWRLLSPYIGLPGELYRFASNGELQN